MSESIMPIASAGAATSTLDPSAEAVARTVPGSMLADTDAPVPPSIVTSSPRIRRACRPRGLPEKRSSMAVWARSAGMFSSW